MCHSSNVTHGWDGVNPVASYRSAELQYADRDDVQAFAAFAKDKFGRVDVIFNNVGVMPVGHEF